MDGILGTATAVCAWWVDRPRVPTGVLVAAHTPPRNWPMHNAVPVAVRMRFKWVEKVLRPATKRFITKNIILIGVMKTNRFLQLEYDHMKWMATVE